MRAPPRQAGLVGLAVGGIAVCAAQWLLWIRSSYSWWWVLAGGIGAVVAFTGMWSASRRYESSDAATAWTVVWVAAAAVVGQVIPISERWIARDPARHGVSGGCCGRGCTSSAATCPSGRGSRPDRPGTSGRTARMAQQRQRPPQYAETLIGPISTHPFGKSDWEVLRRNRAVVPVK